MTRSLGWALLTVLLAACADAPARPADTLALASCCGERVMSPAMDVLWLWPNVERTVAHRRVVGLRDGKTSPIQSIHDLRIEEDR